METRICPLCNQEQPEFKFFRDLKHPNRKVCHRCYLREIKGAINAHVEREMFMDAAALISEAQSSIELIEMRKLDYAKN